MNGNTELLNFIYQNSQIGVEFSILNLMDALKKFEENNIDKSYQ